MDVSLLCHGGAVISGDADEPYAAPLDNRYDGEDFRALAGVRDGDDDIALRDHAEVAVAGLSRMNEERWGAGACHSRGYLRGDVPGFAHAGHDNLALAGEEDAAGLIEGISVDVLPDALKRAYLVLKNPDASTSE